MQDKTSLAALLYTTYCASVGGVAWNGDPLPTWDEFHADPEKAKQAQGWIDAASEALSSTRVPRDTPVTKDHDDYEPVEFAASYYHDGAWWATTIEARDFIDAKIRAAALNMHLEGELE